MELSNVIWHSVVKLGVSVVLHGLREFSSVTSGTNNVTRPSVVLTRGLGNFPGIQ